MNASKTLTSIAAAVALVGSIGFATAQSSTDSTVNVNPANPAATTQTQETQQRVLEVNPNAQTNTTTNAMPNDSGARRDSSTMGGTPAGSPNADATLVDSERAPQADRN